MKHFFCSRIAIKSKVLSTGWIPFPMTLIQLKGLKLTNSCNFVISQRVFTHCRFYFLRDATMAWKKNGETRPLNFGKRNLVGRVSCTLQPSRRSSFDLWRNQIPRRTELTIKHGKLRCHPVVVVQSRPEIIVSVLSFLFSFPPPCHRGRSWKRSKNYYATANGRVELIIPRFNSRR